MYIFLDIDGVLNRRENWDHPYSLNKKNIANLAALVEALPGAQIILTSSWRTGWTENILHCTPQVQILRGLLAEHGLSIAGKTGKAPDGDRLREIRHFLDRNPAGEYLILDDDAGEYSRTPEHLYLVDPVQGLTSEDVKKIRKMLGEEKIR
jgi:hypothetical protein